MKVLALFGTFVLATAQGASNTSSPSKFLSSQDSVAPESDSTQSLDMTSAAMEAALTDLMLGKTAFGATPMGGSVKKIEELLTKTMMPKVIAAHNSDQNNLNRLAAEIAKCGSTKNGALKKAAPPNNDYNKYSGLHKKCRGNQAVLLASKNACMVQQRALYKEKTLKCDHYATLSRKFGNQKDNRAIVTKAGSEKTEQYLRRIAGTICGRHVHGEKGTISKKGGWGGGLPNGMLDQYLKAKDACERAKKAYNTKVQECKKKMAAYQTKRGKCNQYQGLMDTNSCKHAVMVKDTCEAYAGCYYSKREAYRLFRTKAIAEETDRKAEWRGLKRMACLISAFADGKVTNAEVDACKKKAHDTKHLTLKYPKIPPLVKCTVPNLYPATGAYKRKEFDPLPTMAKGVTPAPCSGIDTVPTKPGNGSPKGTKCERVVLQGYYSAGALVKCTKGLDVSKALERNSCPRGTKIFSPGSRNDWKTFLASAGPLRSPNWIIDVTRPANGCGGCTGSPMNSGNKNQRSWTTSDGSRWWLRNSRYTEPNGDYTANCFLDLWGGRPANENAIAFNDGRCSYHSNSYYCQPVNLRLKPKSGSPNSCKCSKVDLTGTYLAGFLVKCEQCLVVHKSSQKNSCPDGMKIFSPASRGDWKTFLSSAVPLFAPHWIIDVTRPQNGCGGCTKYAMKSSTPQQATWKASDGSPWWLRSTTFSEPNGDYTANCYLGMYANPTSPDTMRFNDGRCNYHSRSYYCQPKRNDKNYGGHHRRRRAPPPAPPPKKYCLSVKTRTNKGWCGGALTVEAHGSGFGKGKSGSFGKGSVVWKQCFSKPLTVVKIRGHTTDGWGGFIGYSVDYGRTYKPMHCNNCQVGNAAKDTLYVGVDKDNGNWNDWKPFTACLKGNTCDLVPTKAAPPKLKVGAGCQKGLSILTLKKAGWKTWYNEPYAHHTYKKHVQPTSGDCVLWGSMTSMGATTLSLAGIGKRTVVQDKTLVKENGLWWYTVSPKSNGFSAEKHMSLNSADTAGGNKADCRLSWHFNQRYGGYRSGTRTGLNSDKTWRKVVMYGPCKTR